MEMNKEINPRQPIKELEEEVLLYWKKNKIYEKVKKAEEKKPYFSFYDGPPFATGLPHHGHLLVSTIKDSVIRYWSMRGYKISRRVGWDCHGLPVENLIEQELGLKSKKDIEKIGVEKFNAACRASVLRYTKEWAGTLERLGRWSDYDSAYRTMDNDYIESVWWVFKELWDRGLVYESFRVTPYCSRCGTPLSNFEVGQGYKDITEPSVYLKFKLKGEEATYFLVWTTTSWTLPGNLALAVGKDINYVKLTIDKIDGKISELEMNIKEGETYILADDGEAIHHVFGDNLNFAEGSDYYGPNSKATVYIPQKNGSKIQVDLKNIELKFGRELKGMEYEPLFNVFDPAPVASAPVRGEGNKEKKFFKVYAADFVSVEDGTGIVHIAPHFGEDDFNLFEENNIAVPLVVTVGEDGSIIKGHNIPGEGKFVKDADNDIKADLENRKILFKEENIIHSYPFCWRCDTPLLYYPIKSWYVKVTEIRDLLVRNNEKINWVPSHLKHGRFGKWVADARDWAISRNRFWGAPIPVWVCENEKKKNCKNKKAVGSARELENLSGKKAPSDLHKPYIDKIELKCEKCGGRMKRIPNVFDCWFESGSMPWASWHYPFENKKKVGENFPADFITEAVDQTRGWFYTLHVLATALTENKQHAAKRKSATFRTIAGKEFKVKNDLGDDKPAFCNVISNGFVLAEDGKKLSKKLKNYTEPANLMNKFGADSFRLFLLTGAAMGENYFFGDKAVQDVFRNTILRLLNSYSFFLTYQKIHNFKPTKQKIGLRNVLDLWILVEFYNLLEEIKKNMGKYELVNAARLIPVFIDNLSNWYLRRSRERIKKGDKAALATSYEVLTNLVKVIAPFIPFIAEKFYLSLGGKKESVHLEGFPEFPHGKEYVKERHGLISQMRTTREIIKQALFLRKEAGVKVRQPLSELIVGNRSVLKEFQEIIKEEVNVKEVYFDDKKITKIIGEGALIDAGKSDNVKRPIMKKGNYWIYLNPTKRLDIALNIKIDEDLKTQGLAREIIRQIQDARKKEKCEINKECGLEIFVPDASKNLKKVFENKDFLSEIQNKTLTRIIFSDKKEDTKGGSEVEIEGERVIFKIGK